MTDIQIKKRNGKLVDFDESKIINAIEMAMTETDYGVDSDLSFDIAMHIREELLEDDVIGTVETINDRVEDLLMCSDRKDVARTFILYRDERKRNRDKAWEMTDLQRDILNQKYLDIKNGKKETFNEFVERVSMGNEAIKKAIQNKQFLPGGRILAGIGLDKNVSLSNCYTQPYIEDNLDSIFDTAKEIGKTFAYGGGIGIDISNLRPVDSKVNNAAECSSGSVSFMELYSKVTEIISQRGRRGALLISMKSNHPDIMEFIKIKQNTDKVTKANISVKVDREFMDAVINDDIYKTEFIVNGGQEIIRKEFKAKELFKELVKGNYNYAEPALLMWNRITEYNMCSENPEFEIVGVNACAELPLPAYAACLLGSINVSKFVKKPFTKDAYFDYDSFNELAYEVTKYLDSVLEEGIRKHPLPQQKEAAEKFRQIGVGNMGLGDALIKLGLTYGEDDAIEFVDKMSESMLFATLESSADMAKEKGAFPAYDGTALQSNFLKDRKIPEKVATKIKDHGLRNATLISYAPTGTLSTLLGCSGGAEPVFAFTFKRRTQSLNDGVETIYTVESDIVKDFREVHGDAELPSCFISSQEIDPIKRVKMQAAIQKNVDSAISSTVNLPNDVDINVIGEVYIQAYKLGLKGITVYRDGCLREGILTTDKEEKKEDLCPECEGELEHKDGCVQCVDCGYSPCSL